MSAETNIAMEALRLVPLPGATAANLVNDAICWVRSALGVAETLADHGPGGDQSSRALWAVIYMLQVADATLRLAEEASTVTVAEGLAP